MDSITALQMKILDANSEWFGVPAIELMENAGRGVAKEANKLGNSFVILCGPGNNGGDGFATARYLNAKPKIFFIGRPKSEEAHENFMRARNYRPILLTKDNTEKLKKAIEESDVVIDALFGTGIHGKIREPVRSAIKITNDSGKKVVSVDVPTGLDIDSGRVPDIAIRADVTVAPHAAKGGLPKNPKHTGKIVPVDIGIHPDSYDYVGKGDFKFGYPQRDAKAHKGDGGKVLVVGGSSNYTGAPYFAATAALKAGCDLSYVTAPRKPAGRIALSPDLIVYPLDSEECITEEDVGKILKLKADVLCIGNGLGDGKESLDAARKIISKTKKPMVIDGDALKAVKKLLPKLKKNVVLTPHAAEFKRLFGLKATEKNARKMATKYNCAILLKGREDIIAQGKNIKYNKSGNPYMSKGGTGDVLAGLCAGFLAQGIEPFRAACFAALVSGVAGNLAYGEESIGLMASDVLDIVGLAESLLLR
jgi:NAD(P)H-hydrate epimerase